MSLEKKELKIVGFLCNWCSYGGADTAGVARATQPTDLRIIRVPCSGRVNPLFVLRALLSGADGVLVSGCHPKDCHYTSGNFYARRRLESLKEFLEIIGIDNRRFRYTWVSASEGQRWKEVVSSFTEEIHKLGPAPQFADAKPLYDLPDKLYESLRPLGLGANPALMELKEKIKEQLPNLAGVYGWKEGDGLVAEPFFMQTPEDVDKLIWGPSNVQSLVRFLPKDKDKKIGVVVKGCDSRAVVALLQENLLVRENVVIFAMGCNGTISKDRVKNKLVELTKEENPLIIKVNGHGKTLTVTVQTDEVAKDFDLDIQDIAQDKCRQCNMPQAKVFDYFIGNEVQCPTADTRPAVGIAFLNSLSLEERMGFWRGHIERCIRCYACRNACPMCVCKDNCAGDSRNPHWIPEDDSVNSKLFFQLLHALHLAGRCTGCAECSRACPQGIPVFILKQQYGGIMKRVFGYTAGLDITATPPLLGYQVEEANIQEH